MEDRDPAVLVLDDEELVLEFSTRAVRTIGYSAVSANNVENALDLVNRNPSLRLLLCDVRIGATTGPEFVRQALRDRPHLKVVFMSGGFEDVRFRHTDPLLIKPFDHLQLKTAIESVLVATEPAFVALAVGERRRVHPSS